MKDLKTCRQEIDEIDAELIRLFEKRMAVSRDVVKYKVEHGMKIFQKEREKEVINKNLARVKNKGLSNYIKNFITNNMNISRAYQASLMPNSPLKIAQPRREGIKVGYQGVPGSFSYQATKKYFGEVNNQNYERFEDVFEALKKNEIDYGVVPLENSSTGAINDNYDFITQYEFFIVGEQQLYISQNLLGVKGAKIEDVKDVYSHPQGLLQTSKFLDEHHIGKHRYRNTAVAAKLVAELNDPTVGAIASSEAAELYGLDILAPGIENDKSNHTRFIVIGRELEAPIDAERISMAFTLRHEVGSLFEVMRIIKDHFINMARIESRPLPGNPWEYCFYVDIDGNLGDYNVLAALQELKVSTDQFRLLGNYERKGV
jgi:chorismate mutase/prephenate dehydratase